MASLSEDLVLLVLSENADHVPIYGIKFYTRT